MNKLTLFVFIVVLFIAETGGQDSSDVKPLIVTSIVSVENNLKSLDSNEQVIYLQNEDFSNSFGQYLGLAKQYISFSFESPQGSSLILEFRQNNNLYVESKGDFVIDYKDLNGDLKKVKVSWSEIDLRDSSYYRLYVAEDGSTYRKENNIEVREQKEQKEEKNNLEPINKELNDNKPINKEFLCGDFDDNGIVGFSDYLEFVNVFNLKKGDKKWDGKFDLNKNSEIDFPDFLEFVKGFGKECDFESLTYHTFKIYLDPELVQDMNFAKKVLSMYVQDLNHILEKNTKRRLLFDPEENLILIDFPPQSNSCRFVEDDSDIWIHIKKGDENFARAYASCDNSGVFVIAGMEMTRLFNPLELQHDEFKRYSRQNSVILHEFAHLFGGGIGEYYNLYSIKDTTEIEPIVDLNIFDSNDPYWHSGQKEEFFNDPLLIQPHLLDREDLLKTVRFSELTAIIIDHYYRVDELDKTLPNMKNVVIRVNDVENNPLSSVDLKIFDISSSYPWDSKIATEGRTNEVGEFVWNSPDYKFGNTLNVKLIKYYKENYKPYVKYVSIYDAQEAKLLGGNVEWVIKIVMEPMFVSISEQQTFSESLDRMEESL